jgi:hypothetical protein
VTPTSTAFTVLAVIACLAASGIGLWWAISRAARELTTADTETDGDLTEVIPWADLTQPPRREVPDWLDHQDECDEEFDDLVVALIETDQPWVDAFEALGERLRDYDPEESR